MNKDKKPALNSLPENWNKSRLEFIKTAAGIGSFMVVRAVCWAVRPMLHLATR